MSLLRAALAVVIILAAGLANGHWTSRWAVNPAVRALEARIDVLPAEIGEWTSTSAPLDPRELRAAGGTVAVQRSYRAPDAPPAEVFLIAGRAAPISSHTPDVCYPGAGFVLGQVQRVKVHGSGAESGYSEFATAVATRSEAGHSQAIRIYWAWNDGLGWRAPADPRVAFVGVAALCKLYVILPASGPDDAGDETTPSLLERVATQYGSTLFPDQRDAVVSTSQPINEG